MPSTEGFVYICTFVGDKTILTNRYNIVLKALLVEQLRRNNGLKKLVRGWNFLAICFSNDSPRLRLQRSTMYLYCLSKTTNVNCVMNARNERTRTVKRLS